MLQDLTVTEIVPGSAQVLPAADALALVLADPETYRLEAPFGTGAYTAEGLLAAFQNSTNNPTATEADLIDALRLPEGLAAPAVYTDPYRKSLFDFVSPTVRNNETIDLGSSVAADLTTFLTTARPKTLTVPPRTWLLSGGTGYWIGPSAAGPISILGDGPGVSILKVADGAEVGPAQFINCPFLTIFGVTIDGNSQNNPISTAHGLRARGSDRLTVDWFEIKNSGGYGLGLQASLPSAVGSFKKIMVTRGRIYDTGSDCIDMKNVEDLNDELIFNNLLLGAPDRGATGDVCLDIRGRALVSNIFCILTRVNSGGIRFRVDAIGSNGAGGKLSSLTNFKIDMANIDGTDGVIVDAPNVEIANGKIINADAATTTGVWLTGNAANSVVANVRARGRESGAVAGSGQSFVVQGADSVLTNCFAARMAGGLHFYSAVKGRASLCTAEGCTTGFMSDSGDNVFLGCVAKPDCVTGYSRAAPGDTLVGCMGF